MTGDEKRLQVKVGSIVQVNPNTGNNTFGGCLLVITDIKVWGVVGYVKDIGRDGYKGHLAFTRLTWDEMELTGGSMVWDVNT